MGVGLYLGATRSVSEYVVEMLDADRNPVYSYTRNSESSRKSGSVDMSVDYQRSTHKKDEPLTLSYRFSHFPNELFQRDTKAVLSYQLSMSQQFRLGYNMRIQRPGIWYLNPYVNNADPQNISYG